VDNNGQMVMGIRLPILRGETLRSENNQRKDNHRHCNWLLVLLYWRRQELPFLRADDYSNITKDYEKTKITLHHPGYGNGVKHV
jgi:hypothetical protein